MTRQVSVALALILLTGAAAIAASVHVRQADGTWVELQAAEADGTVGFTVTPAQTDSGQALVVINKPAWMVLEDEIPPELASCSVGDMAVEPQPDADVLDITGLGDPDQREVTFTVTDDANPLDPNSAVLRIDGRPTIRPEVVAEDRGARELTLSADLGDFGPGAWTGTLEVADLAPMANTLSVPLRFSIAGVQVAADGQSAKLSGGGAGFTVKGDKREIVTVEAASIPAFMTLQPQGQKHLYVNEFASLESLGAQSGWHLLDAEVALEDIDGKPVSDEEVGASLGIRFAVHGDIPAVVVTSTATNLAEAARTLYMFWGWLPGDGFVTSDGQAHEWSMGYDDVAPDRWLLLPSKTEGMAGVGWISAEDFGQSRFGTMILYTDPRKPQVASGEAVSMTFALTPATDIEQVAEIAERLVEAGALDFGE